MTNATEIMLSELPQQFQLRLQKNVLVDRFVCDTPEDLKTLPQKCTLGSIAIVAYPPSVYFKNSVGLWVIQTEHKDDVNGGT